MKKTVLTLSVTLAIISSGTKAQNQNAGNNENTVSGCATKSEIITTDCQGLVNNPGADLNWRPSLLNKAVTFKPKAPDEELIKQIKSEKAKLKAVVKGNSEPASGKNVTPVVGANFDGNPNNGSSPLDNSIAISNGGWIVSVANTTVEYDDMNGNTQYYNDLITFINDQQITGVCDPVVLYDAGADRFILFCQTSPITSGSKILLFFSKTNNPLDGWWYYKLTGNPLNNSEGFDYPKLAVTNNELFIAGNLFFDPAGTFDQVILYQINKTTGYTGGSINFQYWYNIEGDPFTLMPVSSGQGTNYGPACYMVSTKNAGGSVIKFYEVTNSIGNNPQMNYYSVSTTAYSLAGDAKQSGTTNTLANNDCRVLSGFYLNGIVHFVFHSDFQNSGYAGINYNRLNVSSKTNTSSMFGLSGFDYSYPSVVSYSGSATDKSVMIGFGRTGSSIYPEIRVVNCDNSMDWSNSTQVKAGLSYVCYSSGCPPERWGDYTGTSRKHNSPTPSVWMSGMYGHTSHKWKTWIAEIHDIGAGIDETLDPEKIKVYPNPVVESFIIEFTLSEKSDLDICVLDINGKIIKELYKGRALQGENVFSFNKASLSAGIYFLSVKTSNKIIKNEKIIISD